MNKNKIKKSPAWYYRNARWVLLGAIILTVGNCLLGLIGSEDYYVFSLQLVYNVFFYDYGPTLVTALAALLILAPYVAAYILSKRKSGWLIAALVLFSLDTAFVLLVFFTAAADYGIAFALLVVGLDLLVHIVGIVLLILGVKHRKVALMSDEELARANTAAGAVAARVEGYEAAVGQVPEIECSVSVSNTGKPGALPGSGIIRFEESEAVVGGKSGLSTAILGEMLSSYKEIARFDYGSVREISYTNKRQTALRFDLSDGRIICFVFPGKETTERFLRLMQQHGVYAPPRTV